MRAGIFAKTFAGVEPLAVLGQVKAAGFGVAHYNMACSGLASMPDVVGEADVSAIKRALAETGVEIAGLSATFNMAHPDLRVREAGLRQLEVLARAARALAIPILTLCTGSRDETDMWRRHADNDSGEAWRDMSRSIAAAITVAARHDVLLGIEPEHANVVSSAAKAIRLLDELGRDRLRIVFDPVNLIHFNQLAQQREIIAEAVDVLGEDIHMAHAKDIGADGRYCAPGQGLVDFRFAFKLLAQTGFSGPIIAHGFGADAARGAHEFLKKVIDG